MPRGGGFGLAGAPTLVSLVIALWAAGCGSMGAQPDATEDASPTDGAGPVSPDGSSVDATSDDATTGAASMDDASTDDGSSEASPSIGPCLGPAPMPVHCTQSSDCGSWGTCPLATEYPLCCGAAFACCSSSSDCCSGECVGGTCTSASQRCSSAADCNDGTTCFEGVCTKFPGSPCSSNLECTSGVCTGSCTCASTSYLCQSNTDCCHGFCIEAHCALSGEGGPCNSYADCANGACLNGVCRCLPAGATGNPGPIEGCCSEWWFVGACVAARGSGCTTRVQDCFGGECVGGVCACVGPGGFCNSDADCCAGATQCVQGRCSTGPVDASTPD